MRNKLIAVILLILVLVLMGRLSLINKDDPEYLSYEFNPTTSTSTVVLELTDSDKWLMYKDKESGVQFEIPSDWKIVNDNELRHNGLMINSPGYEDEWVGLDVGYFKIIQGSTLSVTIENNPAIKTIEEIRDSRSNSGHVRFINEEQILVNGQSALMYDIDDGEPGNVDVQKKSVSFIHNGYLVKISYRSKDSNDEVFRHVLSTFESVQ